LSFAFSADGKSSILEEVVSVSNSKDTWGICAEDGGLAMWGEGIHAGDGGLGMLHEEPGMAEVVSASNSRDTRGIRAEDGGLGVWVEEPGMAEVVSASNSRDTRGICLEEHENDHSKESSGDAGAMKAKSTRGTGTKTKRRVRLQDDNVIREPSGHKRCQHGKRKTRCHECGGGSICEHNRQRGFCKNCGGSSICEHNRQRAFCKTCGGSSICEHNREKKKCKDCGGSGICEHNRQKNRCKECPKCQICTVSTASREGIYGMMCFQCSRAEQDIRLTTTRNITDILRLLHQKGSIKASRQIQLQEVRKKKEEAVKSLLQDHIAGSSTQIVHDQGVLQADSVCDGSRRRPDFQILHDHQEHLDLWVEVDEFQHLKNGAYVCELARINEMVFWARLIHRPCVVIRINLDAFSAPSKPSKTPLPKKERYPMILQVIKEQIAEAKSGMPTFALKIIHLFYNCPPTCDGSCSYIHTKIYTSPLELAQEISSSK
tara:strand:+ start:683 stop:2146 length:1464 start_codon:yes stop_codon:yes gene_type:complete